MLGPHTLSVLQKYKPALLFLGKLLLIYGLWKLFIALVGYSYVQPETTPLPWLTSSWHVLTDLVRNQIIAFLETILTCLGYQPIIDDNVVRTPGSGGILIANYCLAFQIIFLFTALILVFPAAWYHKFWYILAGIIFLHGLNMLRHLLAVITLHNFPQAVGYFEYQHMVSRILFFIIVLALYFVFIKKFGKRG